MSCGRGAVGILFAVTLALLLSAGEASAQCRSGSQRRRSQSNPMTALRQQNALTAGLGQQNPMLAVLGQQNAMLAAMQQPNLQLAAWQLQQQNAVAAAAQQRNAVRLAQAQQPANQPQQRRAQEADDRPPFKPADSPDELEDTAARRLKLAKSLAADGKVDKARDRYEDILQMFPGTKAAAEARKLLDRSGP
jgi:hypothetical protein